MQIRSGYNFPTVGIDSRQRHAEHADANAKIKPHTDEDTRARDKVAALDPLNATPDEPVRVDGRQPLQTTPSLFAGPTDAFSVPVEQ